MTRRRKKPYHLNGMEKDVQTLTTDVQVVKNDILWLKRLSYGTIITAGGTATAVFTQLIRAALN